MVTFGSHCRSIAHTGSPCVMTSSFEFTQCSAGQALFEMARHWLWPLENSRAIRSDLASVYSQRVVNHF